jgi:hypothetical protein
MNDLQDDILDLLDEIFDKISEEYISVEKIVKELDNNK